MISPAHGPYGYRIWMATEDAQGDIKKLMDDCSTWGGSDKRITTSENPDLKRELVAWEFTTEKLAVAIVRLLDHGWHIRSDSEWYY
jgi:hypothetical protein